MFDFWSQVLFETETDNSKNENTFGRKSWHHLLSNEKEQIMSHIHLQVQINVDNTHCSKSDFLSRDIKFCVLINSSNFGQVWEVPNPRDSFLPTKSRKNLLQKIKMCKYTRCLKSHYFSKIQCFSQKTKKNTILSNIWIISTGFCFYKMLIGFGRFLCIFSFSDVFNCWCEWVFVVTWKIKGEKCKEIRNKFERQFHQKGPTDKEGYLRVVNKISENWIFLYLLIYSVFSWSFFLYV